MNSRNTRTAAALAAVIACAAASDAPAEERSWRSVEELTAEERALYDPARDTPRDSAVPYIPAEPYPFEPPYTAEEMGFRSAEFPHISRWEYAMNDAFGVVTSTGYINQGASVCYVSNGARTGLEGYIHQSTPGEPYSRWTMFDVFPPESEGAQQLWLPYRTNLEHRTKMDYFIYSPQLRRVRRQPEPRRDQRFPDNAQTFDDVLGRDPWELEWQLLGTDVLYRTMRFPNTRSKITLNMGEKGFVERDTASLRLMGDAYPHYRPDGGVDTWVVKATARQDWLPGYGEKFLILWLDKHYFYPLRTEKYDREGKLMMVEVRLAELQNPSMGERGYAAFASVYWNVEHDLLGYSFHDGHQVREWTDEERETLFTPEFMRRQWLVEPVKTQVLVTDPEHFFLRPDVFPDKFPGERNVALSAAIAARVAAQEAAGRLVFETGGAAVAAQSGE
jgi:hypothetical protein